MIYLMYFEYIGLKKPKFIYLYNLLGLMSTTLSSRSFPSIVKRGKYMIDKTARQIQLVSQIICLDVCMNIFSKLLAS